MRYSEIIIRIDLKPKFGISVIDKHILVEKILKNKKKFLTVKCGILRYSKHYNPD